ncbi:hypothetical protein GOODEAATRI_005485 [Goodea atripinnis]|uniref:Uncharacterized protein n=1 Tax=Goodea atripinnis TaxID=208336 RepID=A0ABV0PVH9_9TELE
MVFVNYGGGRYWFFRHSSWNGCLVVSCPRYIAVLASLALCASFGNRLAVPHFPSSGTRLPNVIYVTQMPYDPEGVLGSINSVLMAFLGLQVIQVEPHTVPRMLEMPD